MYIYKTASNLRDNNDIARNESSDDSVGVHNACVAQRRFPTRRQSRIFTDPSETYTHPASLRAIPTIGRRDHLQGAKKHNTVDTVLGVTKQPRPIIASYDS